MGVEASQQLQDIFCNTNNKAYWFEIIMRRTIVVMHNFKIITDQIMLNSTKDGTNNSSNNIGRGMLLYVFQGGCEMKLAVFIRVNMRNYVTRFLNRIFLVLITTSQGHIVYYIHVLILFCFVSCRIILRTIFI